MIISLSIAYRTGCQSWSESADSRSRGTNRWKNGLVAGTEADLDRIISTCIKRNLNYFFSSYNSGIESAGPNNQTGYAAQVWSKLEVSKYV